MQSIYFSRITIGSLVLGSLLSGHAPAIAQTDKELDSLLPAYTQARTRYGSLANLISPNINALNEKSYWSEQYLFYRSKVYKILYDYAKAANENPQTFCLPAMEAHDKVLRAEAGVIVLGPLPDPGTQIFGPSRALAQYCARYGIYFNPYEKKM